MRRFVSVWLSLMLVCRMFFAVSACAEEQKDVAEVIREGFYRFDESIDVSSYGLTPQELSNMFSNIIKDDPYLFFVNNNLSYSYNSKGCVLSLKPAYSLTGYEALVALDLCRSIVRKMAELALDYKTDAARALFVHDYICENYGYDVGLQSDDLYSFFLTGRGTCQSYAYAYMAVLRECGIETGFAASDTIEHIWNYVRIDGQWYHVDLTWDDSGDKADRRHFLCSDKMAKERGHKDWYSSQMRSCVSEKYREADFDKLLHKSYPLGDTDHNGKADLCDVALLRRQLVFEDVSNYCKLCADVNGDGSVDEKDLWAFRKKLLGAT